MVLFSVRSTRSTGLTKVDRQMASEAITSRMVGKLVQARRSGLKCSGTLMAAVHGRNYDPLASFVRNTGVSTPVTPLAVQHQGVHIQLRARSGCSV
jgi:hypothetical protein